MPEEKIEPQQDPSFQLVWDGTDGKVRFPGGLFSGIVQLHVSRLLEHQRPNLFAAIPTSALGGDAVLTQPLGEYSTISLAIQGKEIHLWSGFGDSRDAGLRTRREILEKGLEVGWTIHLDAERGRVSAKPFIEMEFDKIMPLEELRLLLDTAQLPHEVDVGVLPQPILPVFPRAFLRKLPNLHGISHQGQDSHWGFASDVLEERLELIRLLTVTR